MNNPWLIIGDGWAAMAAVTKIVADRQPLIWIAGSGAKIRSPLPSVEAGPAEAVWRDLALRADVELGASSTGSYLREFRNKSFREPAWLKAPTPEMRREVMQEILWGSETQMVALFETRFAMTIGELETQIRSFLDLRLLENSVIFQRREAVHVSAIKMEESKVVSITLGSGEEIAASRVIYADRWSSLSSIEGLPKPLPFTRGRNPSGVLQAVFTHSQPMALGFQEGFFGSLHKEAGEEQERHFFGHFSSDGLTSVWTLHLSSEEGDDNHEITKKLRRMKTALDKIFSGETWLPEGKSSFMETVQAEQVKFEESVFFAQGKVFEAPFRLPKVENLEFITDGYGPSVAVLQAYAALGVVKPHERPDAQAKDVDVPNFPSA